MHKIPIVFFFFFLFLSLVSAVAPITEISINLNDGLNIDFPKFATVQQNQDFLFHFHTFNISDGIRMDNTTTNCSFELYNFGGEEQFTIDNVEYEDGDWIVNISSGNFTRTGDYAYLVECHTNSLGGFISFPFRVTPNGEELTQSKNNLFMGGLFLLIIFFIGSLICIYKFDHYIAKFVFYWVSHLLIILIFFSAWQFTNSYAVGYVGLAGIFRVFFYFFIIAVLPMLLVSIAWIVYIHTFNDHFQKLVDKGEKPETAFEMAKKKRRRW